jgi:hypothetical protein
VSTNSEVVEDSEVPSPSLTVSFSLDIVNKWEGGTVSEFYKSQKSTKHYTAKHVWCGMQSDREWEGRGPLPRVIGNRAQLDALPIVLIRRV